MQFNKKGSLYNYVNYTFKNILDPWVLILIPIRIQLTVAILEDLRHISHFFL